MHVCCSLWLLRALVANGLGIMSSCDPARPCRDLLVYPLMPPKVHPLTLSEAFDREASRLSSDIQPRHTFTVGWQETLDEGEIVEVRQARDQWSARKVLSVRAERDSRSIEVYQDDSSGEKRWIELRGSDDVRQVQTCTSALEGRGTGPASPRGGESSPIGQVLFRAPWEGWEPFVASDRISQAIVPGSSFPPAMIHGSHVALSAPAGHAMTSVVLKSWYRTRGGKGVIVLALWHGSTRADAPYPAHPDMSSFRSHTLQLPRFPLVSNRSVRSRLASRSVRPGGAEQAEGTRGPSRSSSTSVAPKKVAIVGSSGGGAAALG